MNLRFRILLLVLFAWAIGWRAHAQCTDHTITVTGGIFPLEVSWQLLAPGGAVVASGFAPSTQTVCLPAGCYTMFMFDSFGDGWNGATFSVTVQATNALVASGTLANGASGQAQVSIGGGCSPAGCTGYLLSVTSGAFPFEISWNLIGTTSIVSSGFAPATVPFCVLPGCYTIQMFDLFGDGWDGATWTVSTATGTPIASGTLATGSLGTATFALGVPSSDCSNQNPVVASDCPDAVNICTNIDFLIDPNGSGTLNEIPPLGSLGNPLLTALDLVPSPWGSDNEGCLQNNELNSTWMVVNVLTGGSLEFTFGGFGTQAGFYDWIMYPFNTISCGQISSNLVAPVRCNWNWVAFGGTGLAATTPPGGNGGNFEPPLNVTAGDRFMICFSNWSSVTTSVPLSFGGTAVVSCSPLPVELTHLTATTHPEGVAVNWTTASELDAYQFEVQRGDGEQWSKIGSVDAVGNSSFASDYAFIDGSPLLGIAYYRLRMVDNDGSYEYSQIVSVRRAADALCSYPNPSNGAFQLKGISKQASVEVMDATGRSVPFRIDPGNQHIALNGLSEGVFLIRITDGHATEVLRHVVQKDPATP